MHAVAIALPSFSNKKKILYIFIYTNVTSVSNVMFPISLLFLWSLFVHLLLYVYAHYPQTSAWRVPVQNQKCSNTRPHCLIVRGRKKENNCVDYYSFAHCAHGDEVIVRPLITQAHSPDELAISTKKSGNGKRGGNDLRSSWWLNRVHLH